MTKALLGGCTSLSPFTPLPLPLTPIPPKENKQTNKQILETGENAGLNFLSNLQQARFIWHYTTFSKVLV